MNEPTEMLFTTRPAFILELPLNSGARILHPELVIINFGHGISDIDIGSLCYASRSAESRISRKPTKVVLATLLKQRAGRIERAIKVLSDFMVGRAPKTVKTYADSLKWMVDWADANGHQDCLAGGDVTRDAFRAYAANVEDRLNLQHLSNSAARFYQVSAREMLEAITGTEKVGRGVRLIPLDRRSRNGTEPIPDHDFAHMLAMSQCLFDGLCDLVLNNQPFPYRLQMPKSLGWKDDYLWIFPTRRWRVPPHEWAALAGSRGPTSSRAYDYENGCLTTVDEIFHLYDRPTILQQRQVAGEMIANARRTLDESNSNSRVYYRALLSMLAHNAFFWLLHANTGGNQQPISDLETDGTVNAAVAHQGYRNIKWRARGKEVPIPLPTKFIPSLKKYMQLRAWLLNGTSFPYLFFSLGRGRLSSKPMRVSGHTISCHYAVLKGIDPTLKPIRVQKTRATVNDALHRKNDAAVVANVMGHSLATENLKYGRGSTVDHQTELTFFLERVSIVAKKQKVIPLRAELGKKDQLLEQGGGCSKYGDPRAMTDDPALQPDCAGGCWFCTRRTLVADDLDARKIASAIFVMEQLILGPVHEAKLRPLICKCEADLEGIAKTADRRSMVERIRKDVFENCNLTRYWAEKYHMLLELEIIV